MDPYKALQILRLFIFFCLLHSRAPVSNYDQQQLWSHAIPTKNDMHYLSSTVLMPNISKIWCHNFTKFWGKLLEGIGHLKKLLKKFLSSFWNSGGIFPMWNHWKKSNFWDIFVTIQNLVKVLQNQTIYIQFRNFFVICQPHSRASVSS